MQRVNPALNGEPVILVHLENPPGIPVSRLRWEVRSWRPIEMWQ